MKSLHDLVNDPDAMALMRRLVAEHIIDEPKEYEHLEPVLSNDKRIRTFHLADQPQDEKGNSIIKTIIAKKQRNDLIDHGKCYCARCRLESPLGLSYKCRWCAVWYCHACAAIHFGPSNNDTEIAE